MRKFTKVGLLALLCGAMGLWGTSQALADSDPENCDKNGHNASSCDFDGDGITNKADDDDDNDGIPDEDDACSRDATNACDDGEEPTPPGPGDVIAQIQQAIADAIDQLPPPPVEPPGGLPPVEPPPVEPPGGLPPVEPPPVEPPADPADVVAAVEQVIAEVTGSLPPIPPAP